MLKNEPDPDWDISAIKSGYLELMRGGAADAASAQQEIEGEWTFRLGDMALSPDMIGHLEARAASSCASPNAAGASCGCSVPATWRTRKPASCRRGNRPSGPRFSYLTSTNPITKGRVSVPLYPVSPEAPAGARALPPQELAGWLVATLDARLRLVRGA